MTQDAPYPTILADLVEEVVLDPGWSVHLGVKTRDTGSPEQGRGLTLSIITTSYDTYHPERGRTYRVIHDFAVPPATYNRQSWQRWLFERYQDVLRHEGMEAFALTAGPEAEDECADCPHWATAHDGRDSTCHGGDCGDHRFRAKKPRLYRPYAPNHGPGNDPYTVREETTDLQRRTQFTGNVDHR